MLALEQHIHAPFETQRNDGDFTEYDDALQVVTRIEALSNQHIDALKTELEDLGGHEASGLKTAFSDIAGAVAGAIDKSRKTKVSKGLRDDYTALSHAIVSHTQLLTTANALRDDAVAALAQRHMNDYASAIMELATCIPAVVVRELANLGLEVDSGASERSRETIEQTWRSTGRGVDVAT
jgi:hypothetical protein